MGMEGVCVIDLAFVGFKRSKFSSLNYQWMCRDSSFDCFWEKYDEFIKKLLIKKTSI